MGRWLLIIGISATAGAYLEKRHTEKKLSFLRSVDIGRADENDAILSSDTYSVCPDCNGRI